MSRSRFDEEEDHIPSFEEEDPELESEEDEENKETEEDEDEPQYVDYGLPYGTEDDEE